MRKQIKIHTDSFWFILGIMLLFCLLAAWLLNSNSRALGIVSKEDAGSVTVFTFVLLMIYLAVRKYGRKIKLFISIAKMIWRKEI